MGKGNLSGEEEKGGKKHLITSREEENLTIEEYKTTELQVRKDNSYLRGGKRQLTLEVNEKYIS